MMRKSQFVSAATEERLKSFSNAEESSENEIDESSQQSRAGVSTTSGTSTNKHEATTSSSTEEELAKHETQQVFRLRMMVILVLMATAGAISYTVYRITDKAEADAFEAQFEGAAEKIIASFTQIIHMLGTASAIGVEMTAHSLNNAEKFPFVTLPNFERRAENARHMSGAMMVGLCPLVERHHFEAWDEYVAGDSSYWV